jgi:hypothetical protein
MKEVKTKQLAKVKAYTKMAEHGRWKMAELA